MMHTLPFGREHSIPIAKHFRFRRSIGMDQEGAAGVHELLSWITIVYSKSHIG